MKTHKYSNHLSFRYSPIKSDFSTLALVIAAFIATVRIAPAQTSFFNYDFESDATGNLNGQSSNWALVSANYSYSPVVTAGPAGSVNTSQVIGGNTSGNSGSYNSTLFSAGFLDSSSVVTLSVDIYVANSYGAAMFGIGNTPSTYAGHGDSESPTFGAWQFGGQELLAFYQGLPSTTQPNYTSATPGGTNFVLTLDHWYRIQSVWDLGAGTATLSYEDLTLGQTNFTPLYFGSSTTIALEGSGANDPVTAWNTVYLRLSPSANPEYMDNLQATTTQSNGNVNTTAIPWVMPWNDTTPSVTDFSSLNAPIGANAVSVDTNGHFVVNGQRIRFLGVNFAWDSPCFTSTNYADSVAGRLAKFGINSVRLNLEDAPYAYNGGLIAYTSTSSTNFNSANLDRLQYLISRLKAHGIYSYVNLLSGREYQVGDGLGPEVTNMNYLDSHVLNFFYAPALALQEDYTTKLLSPTNRYTGLPLAKDPAVAFVEIINENGLIQKWREGVLDTMPARYATNLQAQWNGWLAARYTNDATMLAAWGATNQPLGTNLVVNGDFSNGLTGWNTEQHGNAVAAFSVTDDFTNGQPSAKVVVSTADTVSWYVQMSRSGINLSSNQIYTVSFWAKSSPATNASASVLQGDPPYSLLGYDQNINLTTNWQFFVKTFQPSASYGNARINFGGMGDEVGTFWYADAQLQAGGQVLPVGTSLAAGNVPNIAFNATGGYTGNQAAQRDWVDFLRNLESEYYNTMVAYLRTNIGYNGLVIGTIVSQSPATVQNQLDVIDSHDYWADPQFPGIPWSPTNWIVTNTSMVNTIGDDNTLTTIARLRIKGKPFTVSEYEHCSPNYYGGEGPLMLAAYAGLQDWDGLWLFDYGYGDPATTLGYVQDYFSIGQHPTKLPNLLLAANLFRRYDVKPAVNEITMAMTPDQELDMLQTPNWNIFSSSYLGVPASLAFTNRIDTSVGTNAVGLQTAPPGPSGNVISSDTGQLRWDVSQPGNGILTCDTPLTKFLVGYADNKAVSLSGITFTPGTTRLGWCTLGMTVTQGSSLTNNCSDLIVATGWWENTNQVWTDINKDSVGTNWGGPPVLTEVVPFSVTIPVPTNYVHAWSLDESGQPIAPLSVTGNASSSTLTVSTNANSIWYEVQIDPWMSAYISDLQPTNGQTGVLWTNPIVATIVNLVTDVNTNTLRLMINGVDVTAAATITSTANGWSVAYVPIGGWEAGTQQVVLTFQDNATCPNTTSNSWSFVTQYAPADSPGIFQDAVLRVTFAGTADDVSSNASPALVTNNITYTTDLPPMPNSSGSGAVFNGSNSRISYGLGNNDVLQLQTNLTYHIRVKFNTWSSSQEQWLMGRFDSSGRVSFLDVPTGTYFHVLAGVSSTGSSYWTFQYSDNNTGSPQLATGVFYDIFLRVQEPGIQRLDVYNAQTGANVSSMAYTNASNTALFASTAPLEIGDRSFNPTACLNGVVEQVNVWNRALSNSEITNISNYTSVGPALTAANIQSLQVVSPGMLELRFTSARTGESFTVQETDSLSNPVWTDVNDGQYTLLSDGTFTVQFPTPTASTQFFRVLAN